MSNEYLELDSVVKNPFGKTLYVRGTGAIFVCAVDLQPNLSDLVLYESGGQKNVAKFSEIAGRAQLKLAASGGRIINDAPVLKIIGKITHKLEKL